MGTVKENLNRLLDSYLVQEYEKLEAKKLATNDTQEIMKIIDKQDWIIERREELNL